MIIECWSYMHKLISFIIYMHKIWNNCKIAFVNLFIARSVWKETTCWPFYLKGYSPCFIQLSPKTSRPCVSVFYEQSSKLELKVCLKNNRILFYGHLGFIEGGGPSCFISFYQWYSYRGKLLCKIQWKAKLWITKIASLIKRLANGYYSRCSENNCITFV